MVLWLVLSQTLIESAMFVDSWVRLRATCHRIVCVVMLYMVVPASAWAIEAVDVDRWQVGTIRGVVRDAETRETLPGANVMIDGTSRGTAADAEGQFQLSGLDAGTYLLNVSYIGYESQQVSVSVTDGALVRVEVLLTFRTNEAEEVVVTAQAQGQLAAINQQLASNTITNIVSADRIQELPDVNAAESVGRLPGISIVRSSGEASRIAIRGLSPKYNSVTVNGVRVPSTDANNRSVDLSLISSNMLDGIEVTKALTPDKDADALGGAVDLRLRSAPEDPTLTLQIQGGYTALLGTYDNYKMVASTSRRFFDGAVGVMLGVNSDRYDRTADQFSGSYSLLANPQSENKLEPSVASLSLRENTQVRGRTGGNAIVDIRIPGGKLMVNGFFNRLSSEGGTRNNQLDVNGRVHKYSLSEWSGETSIGSYGINLEQDFGWVSFEVGAALSQSRGESPNNKYWDFMEEAAVSTALDLRWVEPDSIPNAFRNDSSNTYLNYLNIYANETKDDELTLQANVRIPIHLFNNRVNGYLKTGFKQRSRTRSYDVEQTGVGLYYGGGQELRNIIAETAPELGLEVQMNRFPLSYFMDDYTRDNFLEGAYPLGYTLDAAALNTITEISVPYMNYEGQQSLGNDYQGDESVTAGYAMLALNLGSRLMIMPGFRYEAEETDYTAKFVIGKEDRPVGFPVAYRDTTTARDNSFLLPMLHVQVKPTSWMNLRLAYTETITRPDFRQFAPITYVSRFGDWMTAPNTQIRTAKARNYDASLSIYQNHVGFLSVSGFYKEIDDLIYGATFVLLDGQTILPEINIPNITGAPRVNTSLNNPFTATVRGVEFDWQTNFWYLPSVFKGLVLNVNYTLLESETKYPQFYTEKLPIEPRPRRPPFFTEVVRDTFRVGRMFDQPSNIANVTVGYDIGGFSARLSYLFQAEVLRGLATNAEADQFTESYYRWDLALKQKLGRGVEIYANLNNLNNRADRNFQSSIGQYPTFIEYYGFTMDAGVRYSF